jgi:hypothetical protein
METRMKDFLKNPNYTLVGLGVILLGAIFENTTARPHDWGPYVLMVAGFVTMLGVAVGWSRENF